VIGVILLVKVCIINKKGGVAKTTTALAIAAGLIKKGKKVLSIDLDSQCNLTMCTGAQLDGKNVLGGESSLVRLLLCFLFVSNFHRFPE
jgi:chromosome partitioning protein